VSAASGAPQLVTEPLRCQRLRLSRSGQHLLPNVVERRTRAAVVMAQTHIAECPQQRFGAVSTDTIKGIVECTGVVAAAARAGISHGSIHVIAIEPPDHCFKSPLLRLVQQPAHVGFEFAVIGHGCGDQVGAATAAGAMLIALQDLHRRPARLRDPDLAVGDALYDGVGIGGIGKIEFGVEFPRQGISRQREAVCRYRQRFLQMLRKTGRR